MSLLMAATLFFALPLRSEDRRPLTMEEAVFSSRVYPASISRAKADSLLGIVPREPRVLAGR